MDISKSIEQIDPNKCEFRPIIVGVGATGGQIAIRLARMGFDNFIIFDYDVVEAKNVNNQVFEQAHIGTPKVEALKDLLIRINPWIEQNSDFINEPFTEDHKGLLAQPHVLFLCVDKGRREILDFCKTAHLRLLIETRISANEGVVWGVPKKIWSNYLEFVPTREQEENPHSADLSPCGEVMSVESTVAFISVLAANIFRAFAVGDEFVHETIVTVYPTLGFIKNNY